MAPRKKRVNFRKGKPTEVWGTAAQLPDGSFSSVCLWESRMASCFWADPDEAVVKVGVTVLRVARKPKRIAQLTSDGPS